jgi:tetrapyrrole methylase family protein/MazG family protein
MKTQKEKIEYLAKKGDGYTFDDLCLLTDVLRGEGGCPWDREQTHKSIRKDLIEETYEVIEAIDNEDPVLMQEELGDLLLQVTFHAQIEKEEGKAGIDGVVNDICVKLIHRHPHVFGSVVAETSEAVLDNWDKIKVEEKHRDTLTSQLNAIPKQLPALMRAQKVGKKVSFFDFADADEVMAKLYEESNEVKSAIASADAAAIDEEVGDLLFTAVSLARKLGVNAEEALGRATDKFIDRFSRLEAETEKQGADIREMSMSELDAIWDRIKHN